jgi:hypothetical protein
MARIRSIHPGLFTDEAFVILSDAAQIFFLGLWTEADDQGVFEWKPMSLRMRLRPTKDGPVEPLLAEIVAAERILRFEMGGRHYGAIRNFRKYQRPKKPNAIHPITEEIRTYVALTAPSSELDDVEDAQVLPEPVSSTEKSPQMKDEGGRMKDEGEKDTCGVASRPPAVLGPEFIRLPTNRFETQGEEVVIYQPFVAEMQGLYPSMDVGEQLRSMRAWLITNRELRKTRKGMTRFINGWLSRKQDKGNSRETSNRGRGPSAHDKLFAASASIINDLYADDRPGENGGDSADVIPIGRPLLSA